MKTLEPEIAKLSQLVPSKTNPRKHFPDSEIKELSESILSKNLQDPLIVRSIEGKKFEIVDGERRYRALKLLGKDEVEIEI